MKVLMLSTDKKIFENGSGSQERIKEYGSLVDELHIIIFTKTNEAFKEVSWGNVLVYPTRTLFRPLYFFNVLRVVRSIIRSNTYEWIVTAQDPFEVGLSGYLIKRKYKLPLQIQIHTDFLSPYFWQESLKNKIRVVLGKWLVKKADGIRVVSDRIKKSLVTSHWSLADKVVVLPIFVNTEKIKNAPVRTDLHKKYPNYNFIILMASRLSVEKNIGLAIEAVKYLIPNYPNVLLLIVGDGPELKTLKIQVVSHKLQDNVVFESWTDDLVSYYKTADLFLLTSNYEGYGRTIVEAVAANLPVLMTDVGVAVGCIVPVGGKDKLVDRLRLLIGSEVEREKVLEGQKLFSHNCPTKDEYLNLIKQSWQNCFS